MNNKVNNKIKGKAGEDLVCAYLKKQGKLGESAVRLYLEKKGAEILDQNYRIAGGEIDIIAADDGCLVFIEVKTRRNDAYGVPSEAVDYRKQQTISRVASQYIQKYLYFDMIMRFDVAEVWLEKSEINLIKNAFDSYIRY